MNLFDIIGPVMIGPSSSHTAGAVRIGQMAYTLLGETPSKVSVELHQSFAKTCRGHGTDKAIIAGLMGFTPDDIRIRESLVLAAECGMTFSFTETDMSDAHPNSVRIIASVHTDRKVSLQASSVGGGRVRISEVNGLPVDITGDYPTLLCMHQDRLGLISELTLHLAQNKINIANMRVFRSARTELVATFIETDQLIDPDILRKIEQLSGVGSTYSLPPLQL